MSTPSPSILRYRSPYHASICAIEDQVSVTAIRQGCGLGQPYDQHPSTRGRNTITGCVQGLARVLLGYIVPNPPTVAHPVVAQDSSPRASTLWPGLARRPSGVGATGAEGLSPHPKPSDPRSQWHSHMPYPPALVRRPLYQPADTRQRFLWAHRQAPQNGDRIA